MASVDSPHRARSVVQDLHGLHARLSELGKVELRMALAPVVGRLHEPLEAKEMRDAVDASVALCKLMYSRARSAEALPLANALFAQASLAHDERSMRRAAVLCGLMAADSTDVVGAIEHYVAALRIPAAADPALEASGIWNNIGLAMGIAGNYELAARCYQRCIALTDALPGDVYNRYIGHVNLADSLYQSGAIEEGLGFAQRALREQTLEFRERDLHNALLLERNLVRLLVASGRAGDAEPHVAQCSVLADRSQSPRALIAAAATRATYELALGQTDFALTRLEHALARAREVPAALRDTLVCMVYAEERAGNYERALVRMGELSEHIYRAAIDRARQHVELARLPVIARTRLDVEQEQAKARLVSKVSPPDVPETWSALDRLAVSAALRIDPTGWHGKRVGALVKALALAQGSHPLQALEMGLAAELHDIGMLSVPEGILAKRSPLNESERAIVNRHVEAGAEMLGDDRHPRVFLAREIARYHHAHWDGDGHPEGVGGNRIPYAARLCAIADAYDAMVCGIGSRKPHTMHQALAELGRNAGRQFDPRLVAGFDNLIRTETEDLGMDLASNAGLEGFQALVNALQQDRGLV